MAYTSQSIANYNANPPPDDGSALDSNKLTWAKHKTKLADPIKTLAEAINTANVNAWADLADTSNDPQGDALIGVKDTVSNAVATNLHAYLNLKVKGLKKTFGATGDGVADDTTAVTNAFASGKIIEVEEGTYLYSSGASFSAAGQEVHGVSRLAILSYTGAGTAIDFNSNAYCRLSNLKLTTATGATGISVPTVSHNFGIDKVWVTGFSTVGILVSQSFYGEIRHNDIQDNDIGLQFTNQANGNMVTNNSIRQCEIGLQIDDTTNATNGNLIACNEIESAAAGSTYAIKVLGGQSNTFECNRIEYTQGTAHVFVNSGASAVAQFNNFIGNQLQGTIAAYIFGDGTGSAQVPGNMVIGGRGAGAITINSDVSNLYFIAPPGSYPSTLTDNGSGSVIDIDSVNSKQYIKQSTNKSYSLQVGGSSTIMDIGSNNKYQLKVNSNVNIDAGTDGSVTVLGAWNKPFIMGTHYLWIDGSNRLMINSSAPANINDGTVVGTQT